MKITLDHNCLINLENKTEVGRAIQNIVDSEETECFVVNIGASEMREKGIVPDRYGLFEEFLESVALDNLKRLSPMALFDVTFFDYCIYSDDEMVRLANEIDAILFPNKLEGNIEQEGIDSAFGRKWLNRICDVHTLFCHIKNENDIFLTADKNFMKATKLPKLIALGARSIKHPTEMDV